MPVGRDPNYVSEVNAAIRNRAGARRRRIDSILDPLEEQGRMDRMQQISVSPDLGGVDDPGYVGATVADMVGGSGSGPVAQARNAVARGPLRQMLGGGGGVSYAPQATISDCPGGVCGVPRSAPMQATVVGAPMQQGIPMEGMPIDGGMGEPVPTPPPTPKWNDGESASSYFNRLSPEVFAWASPQPASLARASVLGSEYASDLLGAAADQGVIANQRMAIEETIRNNEFSRTLDANEDKRIDAAHKEEVRLAAAEATNTALQNPAERATTANSLRLAAINGDLTAQEAIDNITDLRMADTVPSPVAGGKQDGSVQAIQADQRDTLRASVRAEVARSVNGGIAVKTFIDMSPYISGVAKNPDGTPAKFDEQTAGKVLDSLTSAYSEQFAKPWSELDSALASEVWPVVRKALPDLYAREALSSGADEKAQKAARARGESDAAKFFDYVHTQFRVWHGQYQVGGWKPNAPRNPAPQPAPGTAPYRGYQWRAPPPGVGPAKPPAPPSPTQSSMMFSRPTVDTNDTLPPVPAQRMARSV